MANPFNLFDFSALGGVSNMVNKQQVSGATGGGLTPPTVSGQSLQQTPMQPSMQTTQPVAKTGMFDTYMKDPKISKQGKAKMLGDLQAGKITENDANGIIENIYKTQPKEEAGLWDYTKGLAGRVGEGIAQVPSDIINIGAQAVGSDFRAQPLSQSIFGVTPSSEKGFIGRSADIIGKSGKNIGEISEQIPNQTMAESIGQGTAETLFGTANVFGEVFMAGLSTLAPDIAKEKLKTYIQEVAQSKGGQKAITVAKQIENNYNEFAKNNPRAARNLKAVAQLGSVATELYGVGKGKQVISGIGEKTGNIVQKGGEVLGKTGEVISDIGGKTGEIVTQPFKSIINTAKKYTGTPEEVSGIQSAIKPKQRIKNGVLQRTQDNINNEIKLTNGLIRESGVKPTDLKSYKDAIKGEMEKVGSEINRLTGQDLKIDLTPTAGKIRQIANSKEVQMLDPGESAKLMRMADDIQTNGRISLSEAEAMNQFINDTLKSTTSSASEAYKRGLQTLVSDIRQGLDDTISNIPGQFKEIKKTYGALRNIYGDTVAREIVFNRQNMGGLVDSIGAIEGAGNIMSGGLKIITGRLGEGASDIGKGIAANTMGRFIKSKNDPNNIIRSIFQKGGEKRTLPNVASKPKVIPLLPAGKPMTGYAPGKIKATSEAISGKVGERPGTVAKLEDKQGIIKEQQSILKKGSKLQSDAKEINMLLDNVRGRGTPDVVDRLILKMEGLLGEDKISILDAEEILKLSKTKLSDDIMDRVYRAIDEKGYTINNDGFIEKAKPSIIPKPTTPKVVDGKIVPKEIPEGYFKNAFGEIVKNPSKGKQGSLNIGQIGKDLGLVKKEYSPEGAIRTYTNSSDKINAMLREGKINPQIESLDKFLSQTKNYEGTVYRGLTVPKSKAESIIADIKKNGITDKAYISSSRNFGDATTYSKTSKSAGTKGIMFEIESKNGKVIDPKYNAYNEEEIIFPRGTKFEYVGEYKDAGKGTIIKLKEGNKQPTGIIKSPIEKVPEGLIEEAKKYKTLTDWMDSKKSLHRPPDFENGSRLDDLTKSYGEDIYSKNALQYYGDRNYLPDRKVLDIINKAKNNPEMEVTIYRAIEKGDRETFQPGDWVALTKEYVKEHGEGPLKGKFQIIEKKVKVKDLSGNADSLQEYGYRPNNHKDYNKQQLTDIYNQAHKK